MVNKETKIQREKERHGRDTGREGRMKEEKRKKRRVKEKGSLKPRFNLRL